MSGELAPGMIVAFTESGVEILAPDPPRPAPASLWKYRCICGKRFISDYASAGLAYCPKVRCQRTCRAIEPVSQ